MIEPKEEPQAAGPSVSLSKLLSGSVEDGMTNISAHFVQTICESIGVDQINQDAAEDVAITVSHRVRELAQLARKIAIRSKRTRVLKEDVDRAIRFKNYEGVFGHTGPDGLNYKFISSDSTKAGGVGGDGLHVPDEQIVDLAPLLNASVPKAPVQPRIKVHWLAIDGVQPLIPENPSSVKRKLDSNVDANKSSKNPKSMSQKARRIEHVSLKTSATHELTAEQMTYFKEVTEACVGANEVKRAQALQSLATDTGLQPMLPRFAVFVSEGVRYNILNPNLAILIYIMRAMKSLVENTSLTLEPQLHVMLPPVLSCALSSRVCAKPEADNHWALRDFAVRIIVSICRDYDAFVSCLQARVVQSVSAVWSNPACSPAQLYGALFLFAEIGASTFKQFVMPRVKSLADQIKRWQADRHAVVKTAADKLHALLMKKLVAYLKANRSDEQHISSLHDYRDQFGEIGLNVYQEMQRVLNINDNRPSRSSTPNTPVSAPFGTPSTNSRFTFAGSNNDVGQTPEPSQLAAGSQNSARPKQAPPVELEDYYNY